MDSTVESMEALLGIAPSESSIGDAMSHHDAHDTNPMDGEQGDWLTSVVRMSEKSWSQATSPVPSAEGSEPQLWQGNTAFEPKGQREEAEYKGAMGASGASTPTPPASASLRGGGGDAEVASSSFHVHKAQYEESTPYVASTDNTDVLKSELIQGMEREKALAEAVSRMKGLADDRARQTERVKRDLETTAGEVKELKAEYQRHSADSREAHAILQQSKMFLQTVAQQAKAQLGGQSEDVLATLGDERGAGGGGGSGLSHTAGQVHNATQKLCIGLLEGHRGQAATVESLKQQLEERGAAPSAVPSPFQGGYHEQGNVAGSSFKAERTAAFLAAAAAAGPAEPLAADVFQWGDTNTGAMGVMPPLPPDLTEEEREVWGTMEDELEACRASRAGLVSTLGTLQGALSQQLVAKSRECQQLRERCKALEAERDKVSVRSFGSFATPAPGAECAESLAQENECLYMMNALSLEDQSRLKEYISSLEAILGQAGVPPSRFHHLRPVMSSHGGGGSGGSTVGRGGGGGSARATPATAHRHQSPSRAEGERLAGADVRGLYEPIDTHSSSVEKITHSLARTGERMLHDVNSFIEKGLHSSTLTRKIELEERDARGEEGGAYGRRGGLAARLGVGQPRGARLGGRPPVPLDGRAVDKLEMENAALRRLLQNSAVKSVSGRGV